MGYLPEIHIPHKHLVKLNTVEGLEVGMDSLIVNSLRMRPDRVVVGEVRKKTEIHSFIDTILAGQGRGSLCTFHAQSAQEAIHRFQSMGVQEQDLNSIDLIIVLRRIAKGNIKSNKLTEKRKVIEVAEMLEAENKIKLNKLFEFDFKKDKLIRKNESIRIMKKILETFNCGAEELRKALDERKDFFEKQKETDFEELFEKLNSRE
ncbi:MAG: ATPase, T2SS/T4P/T4SS family [Candidatus Diapherotrites archaeon]